MTHGSQLGPPSGKTRKTMFQLPMLGRVHVLEPRGPHFKIVEPEVAITNGINNPVWLVYVFQLPLGEKNSWRNGKKTALKSPKAINNPL